MYIFLLIAIMVVDIAALISSSHPLKMQNIDRMLTPSQVPPSRRHKLKPANKKVVLDVARTSLIPSQVSGVRVHQISSTKIAVVTNNEMDDIETKKVENKKHQSPQTRRSRATNVRPREGSISRKSRKTRSGNLPDVLWRSIPLEHIRRHPLFVPLPDPESIDHLDSKEDVRNFRQESWQWDVLHEGRMTTSQAVAALGFLEPGVGEILGVPKGLRRGGQGAYHRLRKPATTRTLDEMNAKLCIGHGNSHNSSIEDKTNESDDSDGSVWTQPAKFPFAAKYMVRITEEEYKNRKEISKRWKSGNKQWSIRMVWGNVQEATSLLTALNYFWERDNRVFMKEIGMCGAGLEFNQTVPTGLIIGATPDAVLCHPDGRIEAVEVKNHCPFVPNHSRYNGSNGRRNKRYGNDAFQLSRQKLSKSDSVMCQYIPQLMMEMLCLGENCESAIMVRQTATNGSLILRIKRDNGWIEEMLYWLDRFYQDFVLQEIIPSKNFFLESDNPVDRDRYKRFLELTKQIETNIELLEHVPHHKIQRALADRDVSTNLFFDEK